MKLNQLLVIVGLIAGGLIVYGATASWADFIAPFVGTVSIPGSDTDRGKDFMILGGIAALFVLLGFMEDQIAQFWGGLILAGVGIGTWVHVADTKDKINEIIAREINTADAVGFAHLGQGLSLITMGSVVAIIAGIALVLFSFSHSREIASQTATMSPEWMNRN